MQAGFNGKGEYQLCLLHIAFNVFWFAKLYTESNVYSTMIDA